MRYNILYIISTSHLGGAPVQAYSLANTFKDKINLTVIAPNDGPYFTKFKDLGIEIFNVPIRQINPLLWISIAYIIRRNHIDLIHSHGKAAGLHSRIVGWLTKTPVIHTFHGIHFKKYGLFSRLYLSIEKLLGRTTTTFIAVAEHEKITAIKMGFANSNHITTIYNAVPEYRCLARQPSNDQLKLISVGRFYHEKGQEYLINAMPKILESISNAQLILIGDGVKLESAKQKIAKLNLENKINMIGAQDQTTIYRYLCDSNIYISPSLGEGLPLVLLEAGQVGLPIVATNVSGNNEVIQDKSTGLLIPPANSLAIAEAVIEMYYNPEMAKKYSTAIQNTIRNKFGFEQMINKTYKLYQKAIDQNA